MNAKLNIEQSNFEPPNLKIQELEGQLAEVRKELSQWHEAFPNKDRRPATIIHLLSDIGRDRDELREALERANALIGAQANENDKLVASLIKENQALREQVATMSNRIT